MRLTFALLICLCITTEHVLAAGSEAIIKQRAKELSNQNNVRQGVPPPAAAQPAKPAQAPAQTVATPAVRLQADLAAIKPNVPATTAQRQKIVADLIALADGVKKPSSGAVSKLVQDMTAALSQKAPSEAARARLVQDLKAAMNPGNMPATQVQDIVADVQAVFQTSGIARKDAVVIADDLKVITTELHAAR